MRGSSHGSACADARRPAVAPTSAPSARMREEWGREDSNLRRLSRRVYSPFPLATRAHPRERSSVIVTSLLVRSYDAIVVGAGPAESTTAYRLAAAGASRL